MDDFTYDVAGRLLIQKRTLDQHTETIAAYCYDDLGQVERKTLGGKLQTLDYSYNIRGWLTQTNDPDDLADDLFAYTLDYLPNGNIKQMDWNHNGQQAQSYTYGYDALNRILRATHSSENYHVSGIEYDLNGNLDKLNRNGYLGESFGPMDVLTYEYTGNRLTQVTDTGDTAFGFKTPKATYTYDRNGNMTSDSGKGISDIDYNHLNLPESIGLTAVRLDIPMMRLV